MKLRSLSFRSRYVLVIGAAVFLVSVSVLFSDSIEDMITGATGQISAGSLGSVTGALTNAIVGTIDSLSYFGVFGLMLLEATSLPVPSEVVLPFAGYLVSIGKLEFWLTVALATLAGVLGALVDYYIGRFVGMKAVSSYGSRFFISAEQMKKVESLFEKHGTPIVFASRLIPGVRTLISFPAGGARMNLAKFTFYTALGCFGFNALLVYAGDYLGSHWSTIRAIGILELAATLIVLVSSAWLFLRIQHRQNSKTASNAPN